MNELNISRSIVSILEFLQEYDIEVIQHNSFEKFEKVAKRARGNKVSGMFDSRYFDFTARNSFWLEYRRKDKTMSVMAFRIRDIGDDALIDHLSEQERVYPKPNKMGTGHAPLVSEISGNIVYIGEFSLPVEMQKKGLAGICVTLGVLASLSRWPDGDWFWGFMSEDMAARGYSERIGFSRIEPRGVVWDIEPEGISTKDWIVAFENVSARRLADLIADVGIQVLLPHKRASRR
ncbi:MAG: hypothetical protein AAF478_03450 [Pseudomonadota bacterium]